MDYREKRTDDRKVARLVLREMTVGSRFFYADNGHEILDPLQAVRAIQDGNCVVIRHPSLAPVPDPETGKVHCHCGCGCDLPAAAFVVARRARYVPAMCMGVWGGPASAN